MTQYAPAYTSMECEEDQEYNDEPYAIFWGLNWQDTKKIKSFVRRTKVYQNIDDGERGGANRGYDDKVLTKSGRWETLNRKKHFIIVQAMEHDRGSPTYIVKALRYLLPSDITPLILKGKPEDEIVEHAKEFMTKRIDELRGVGGHAIKLFLEGGKVELFNLVVSEINPDDRVGNPKVLPLSGDKQELKFSSSDSGTYVYKFNIQSR